MSEEGSAPSDNDEKTNLGERVFAAAREGHHMTLYTLLADQATPQRVSILIRTSLRS